MYANEIETTTTEIKTQQDNEIPDVRENAHQIKMFHPYVGGSVGYPYVLTINLGARLQVEHNAFDFGGSVTPLFLFDTISAYANYLYYPIPSPTSQFYMGLGGKIGCGMIVGFASGMLFAMATPQFVLGQEFHGRDNDNLGFFIQAEAGATYLNGKEYGLGKKKFITWQPNVMLTAGFTF